MLPADLEFADAESLADLRTFLVRARAVADGEVRLAAAGSSLAVYVAVLAPGQLGEAVPTILGLRVARLARDPGPGMDAVYPIGAVADRLARSGAGETVLPLPPAESTAAWTGVAPPRGGWERVGECDAGALRRAAEDGMRAVASALPENAGRPVLATVRQRIWSSPMEGSGPVVPTGVAFAAQTLGFLPPEGPVPVFASGPWLRLTSPVGHVLVRRATLL
ncbi:hypothetical protein ACQ7DA_08215 [Zafaria sp. J156]|uniref:hypothetical protein n=1 Tax=Zafaria sp. J156 TaxID=3116490 RepID=UPI002E78AA4D|nr:hypothetical protein [Zafaria sp. J156]MEE1620647.1 hypothetical protein [Zafaria sp. J156]